MYVHTLIYGWFPKHICARMTILTIALRTDLNGWIGLAFILVENSSKQLKRFFLANGKGTRVHRQCILKIYTLSISRDERGFPLTQYITNGGISHARYTITHFKQHHRVLRLISNRMSV